MQIQIKHFIALFFLFTIMCCFSCFAQIQEQSRVDSMLSLLPHTKEDTNRVKLLDDLSSSFLDVSVDTEIIFAQKELDLATKLGWKRGIALAYSNLGTGYDTKFDYPKALEYYKKATDAFEQIKDKNDMGDELVNVAYIYKQQDNLTGALNTYLAAIKNYQETRDKNKVAATYESIGNMYSENADFPNALDYFQEAKKEYAAIDDKYNYAATLSNIGNVYFNEDDYDNALEYHYKSLNLYQQLDRKTNMAYEYQIIGNIYIETEDFATSIMNEQISLSIAEETDNDVLAGYVLASIGNGYLLLAKEADNKHVKKRNFPQRKKQYDIPARKKARLHLAIDYLQRGLVIGKRMQINQLTEYCYETLADAYKLNGDVKKAIEYTNNFHELMDSVYSKRNKEQITMLEIKNQYKNERITDSVKAYYQKKKADLILKRQRSYLWIALSFSALVLIIITLIYFNYRKIRGLHKKVTIQKTELENSNRDKERILHIVAHDLRSPVGSISYLCDLMLMSNRTKGEIIESVKMIKNASVGALELINELVIQNESAQSPVTKPEDICALIENCVNMRNFKAKEKQQTLALNLPAHPVFIPINYEKINRVIDNLIGNAIKFSNEKQVIEITLEEEQTHVLIKIKYSGIGIPENMKQGLFEIFTESKRYGTLGEKPFGLGLYISRQIIAAHNGTINFESKEDAGTTFFVRLPKGG